MTLITILAWTVLFIHCWPLAVLALLAWPIVWLLLIPFHSRSVVGSRLAAYARCSSPPQGRRACAP